MPMQPIGGPLQFDQGPLGAPLQMPAPAPKKKGGMFGSGLGVGEAIVAALNGYLAGRGNPVGMANMQMMQRQREQAAEQAQYGQRREDEFQDFVRKQAYQAANPSPVNNDTVQDYNFWKGVLPPDQFEQYIGNKVNPPQYMNVPGVGLVQIPRGGMPQAGAAAPQGVTFTPMDEGGPTPPASGGFPRSY